jgi:hypothetical protein
LNRSAASNHDGEVSEAGNRGAAAVKQWREGGERLAQRRMHRL